MNPIKLHLCQAANSQERCYTIQSEIGDWSPTSSVCTCVECYKFILVWNKWNLDLRCYDHFKKKKKLLWNNLIIKHCCIILSTLLNLYRINLILTKQPCLIIGSVSDDWNELNHYNQLNTAVRWMGSDGWMYRIHRNANSTACWPVPDGAGSVRRLREGMEE